MAFYFTAGLQVFSLLFYFMFASGELQPWARDTYTIVPDTCERYSLLDDNVATVKYGSNHNGSIKNTDSICNQTEEAVSSIDSIAETKKRNVDTPNLLVEMETSLTVDGFRVNNDCVTTVLRSKHLLSK